MYLHLLEVLLRSKPVIVPGSSLQEVWGEVQEAGSGAEIPGLTFTSKPN